MVDYVEIFNSIAQDPRLDTKTIHVIEKNGKEFMEFLSKKEVIEMSLQKSIAHNAAAIVIFSFVVKFLKLSIPLEEIYKFTATYLNTNVIEKHSHIVRTYMRTCFYTVLLKSQSNKKDIETSRKIVYLFNSVQNNSNTFWPNQAYSVYFAYLDKDYSNVQTILKNLLIQLKEYQYKEVYDFTMLNFYRGLIFLSEEVN